VLYLTSYFLKHLQLPITAGGDTLAKEAVTKIQEAEEKAAEIVRAASDKAKQISEDALKTAYDERDKILKNAASKKTSLIDEAKAVAAKECANLIEAGNSEIGKILNPSPDKFKLSVKIVTERIVSASGNS